MASLIIETHRSEDGAWLKPVESLSQRLLATDKSYQDRFLAKYKIEVSLHIDPDDIDELPKKRFWYIETVERWFSENTLGYATLEQMDIKWCYNLFLAHEDALTLFLLKFQPKGVIPVDMSLFQ